MTDRDASHALPREIPALATGAVHVWWTPIDLSPEALQRAANALDPGTLARADRMRRDADRRRIVLAHGLLRQLLSAAVGVPAPELALERRCSSCGATDHGRPWLPGGPSFGISHGGDLAVVALGAPDASVAVDVEAVQPAARWEAVRRAAFTDDEWAATADDPEAGRTALWSRKEAAVKATGHGISLDLHRVRFFPVPAEPAGYEVGFEPGDPAGPDGAWAVADLDLAAGHRAAVAWRGIPGAVVTVHRAAL